MGEATEALTTPRVLEMTGRELDRLLAERLGLPLEPPCPRYHTTDEAEYGRTSGTWSGWCFTCSEAIANVDREPLRYSTDIAAAWTVVDHMRARALVDRALRLESAGVGYIAAFYSHEHPLNRVGAFAHGETAPLAICRAALLTTLEDGGQ